MDAQAPRETVRQLADDLGWLEEHCRKQPDLALHAAQLRLASALTRNVVGPAIDGQPARPLFLCVVGGAGAGKSTVVNLLVGSTVVEANPQAGYTRHPTACVPDGSNFSWPSYAGFLGPLTRAHGERPADADEDVYQVKTVPARDNPADPTADLVIWDCPDMTTWASAGYVSRLLEVVALADVVVYVASDERYNDEVPTQFLQQVVRAGKAVICCLTKMNPDQAEPLLAHFRQEVLARLPVPVAGLSAAADAVHIPCVALPHLSPDARRDPTTPDARKYRVALLNQLLVLCPDPVLARARTVKNAVGYLETAADGLLEVARKDLAEVETWRGLVAAGRSEFEGRYRREFLAGEAFRRFDRTRDQVLEMLELPGPAKALSALLALLRLPYRYARGLLVNLAARPEAPGQSEQAVCAAALAAWLDGLQAEALRRGDGHPLWKQVTRGFDAGLKQVSLDRFQQVFRSFALKETDELDRAASAVPAALAANPALLVAARLAVVGVDLAALGAFLAATWVPSVYALLAVPVVVALSRQLTEWAVRSAVEVGRSRLRGQREALVAQHLSGPMGEYLAEWPTSGGTPLDRLQQALRRVPEAIKSLAKLAPTRPPEPARP